jgi:hypothetical protein
MTFYNKKQNHHNVTGAGLSSVAVRQAKIRESSGLIQLTVTFETDHVLAQGQPMPCPISLIIGWKSSGSSLPID